MAEISLYTDKIIHILDSFWKFIMSIAGEGHEIIVIVAGLLLAFVCAASFVSYFLHKSVVVSYGQSFIDENSGNFFTVDLQEGKISLKDEFLRELNK